MKAISFDLWGTLIRSNPEFSIHQETLVKEFTDIQDWRERKKEMKKEISAKEIRGIHTCRMEAYKSLLKGLSINELENFIRYSNELFLKHPPLIREPETDLVSILRDKGYRVYISSNSTLIYGDVLSKIVFDNFNIVRKNCKFSDEVGGTKPDRRMFDFDIKPTFHIGDNIITDGASENFGIEHYYINKEQNFKTFLEYANI